MDVSCSDDNLKCMPCDDVAQPQNIDFATCGEATQEQPVTESQEYEQPFGEAKDNNCGEVTDNNCGEVTDKPSTEEVCGCVDCVGDCHIPFVPIPLSLADAEQYNALLANKQTLGLLYNSMLKSCDEYYLGFMGFWNHLRSSYNLPLDFRFEILNQSIVEEIKPDVPIDES